MRAAERRRRRSKQPPTATARKSAAIYIGLICTQPRWGVVLAETEAEVVALKADLDSNARHEGTLLGQVRSQRPQGGQAQPETEQKVRRVNARASAAVRGLK